MTARKAGDREVFPSAGAVVSLFRGYGAGYDGLVPPYVVLTELQGRFSEAGFLGPRYQPFATGGDPAQQKMMLYFMPGMFTVFMLFLPAGLGVYMFTNSVLGIAQQRQEHPTDRHPSLAERLRALSSDLIEATMMSVSTPAPHQLSLS